MIHSLEQLAKLTNSSFKGDRNIQVDSIASIDEATDGQISFISNPKYISKLKDSTASVVILNQALANEFDGNALINDDPYLTFARILKFLYPEPKISGAVHKSATIDHSVTLSKSVNIGPNVVIGEGSIIEDGVIINAGCYIGKESHLAKGVHLYPNVTLYKGTIIGENTIIHSGAVIGADGFGIAPMPDKSWYKILQVGNVVIGNDVEIGASTTVDRAALGTTKICDGVKLDNQVHIGHNVKIDENTVVAAGTLIGGSSTIGKRCQIAGGVAISGHLSITDDVIITGKSMVIKSIKRPGIYSSGIVADENRKWRKNAARFRKLDEMAKRISHLEKKLNEK